MFRNDNELNDVLERIHALLKGIKGMAAYAMQQHFGDGPTFVLLYVTRRVGAESSKNADNSGSSDLPLLG